MSTPRPSMDLVRSATDAQVLRAFLDEERLTRAEVAVRTQLSKPTAGESVRRLTAAGLLRDTGERTRGRGRVGTYYALSDGLGTAAAISIAPQGVVAELLDVRGTVLGRAEEELQRPARPDEVAERLRAAVRRLGEGAPGPLRLAVVSAADPVERASGRLVHLPDAPFLVGELSPADVLAPLVDGPVLVDNDVNWAARAERAADPEPLDDFVYLYLDEGLGCAVVSDGDVRRGHRGLAGEVAHLVTWGPHGQAVAFTEVFAALGLRQHGSTAIAVDRVLELLDEGVTSSAARDVLVRGVCGVLAAVVALTDPAVVILGGTWGSHPLLIEEVRSRFQRSPRSVPVQAARVTDEPALRGTHGPAVDQLRAATLPGLGGTAG
ncbi:ROK family transcriptional regulator [Vallicoccus soli]|uniref:ROK family transcriptional regulator n=1 Tax=Vallicoccus soli TaxID=2339232 RepID=A0A3A3ZHJ5_9ACTN|nr:ROK family transcriptional regulator [Vallicoccus soli]RJK94736.1 ROK family transcriptional regulator [Vallicoccus soli]